ncbi:chorismate--pyruvate lyase family protein [Marinomonas mediterranea]|uniref:chorismate--pyruvate lyase family protein n=1 Tax=Marinomonas mediterranea TaxID=119864 RepID=UPI002348FF2A|nr:chorismate pyruvate-lyase family protein [Marinomonas mediterranea]WCN11184.1 DUF98 domain-containing protein [Marinomonas mediterranea]
MIVISSEKQSNQNKELNLDQYNEHSLSVLQRLILESDGTLTQLVGNLVGESIIAEKLFEGPTPDSRSQTSSFQQDERYLQKRIVSLKGQKSGFCYLYANSIVYHDNLNVNFSRALLDSKITIGRAWERYRVETYKELDAWGFESAGTLGRHFNLSSEALLLFRTYSVYSGGKKIFLITEKFPMAWFQKPNQAYPANSQPHAQERYDEIL